MRLLKMAMVLCLALTAAVFASCRPEGLKELRCTELEPTWETPGYGQALSDAEAASGFYKALCFSEREGLFYSQPEDQYTESEIIRILSGGQPERLALCRNAQGNAVPVLCGNGGYVCSKGIYMTEERLWSKESVAVSALETGETQYFRAPTSAQSTQTELIPYRDGFLLFDTEYSRSGDDGTLSSRSYSVRLCENGEFDPERFVTLAEGRFDEWRETGKSFDAALSFRDDGDFLWLLCEELEKGERTAPRLEKYSLDGKLLETRELDGWDGIADMIEERHSLPYDAGAEDFAVLGRDGRWLYIDYQADAVFFEWQNGKYRPVGSPAPDDEGDASPNHFHIAAPRCSGCENSAGGAAAELFWLYKTSYEGNIDALFAFDVSSGRLYSVALPAEPDGSCLDYISISCGGDILLRRYNWQEQTRLEPEGIWLLTAESAAGAMK